MPETIYYVADTVLENKSAYSQHVIKMCDAFGLVGKNVKLIVPYRSSKINLYRQQSINKSVKSAKSASDTPNGSPIAKTQSVRSASRAASIAGKFDNFAHDRANSVASSKINLERRASPETDRYCHIFIFYFSLFILYLQNKKTKKQKNKK